MRSVDRLDKFLRGAYQAARRVQFQEDSIGILIIGVSSSPLHVFRAHLMDHHVELNLHHPRLGPGCPESLGENYPDENKKEQECRTQDFGAQRVFLAAGAPA